MPQTAVSDNSQDELKFKFALKNMLPIPSTAEQQIILDEYKLQLTQFSISINRIIKDEINDENCVYLLKLLAGMYVLMKTTLLSPPVYKELFDAVVRIELDARDFILKWSETSKLCKQVELFEMAWWCESALPRAYLVTLLFSSLPALWNDPKYISDTFSACKTLQHPLKGSFLYSRLHGFLKQIYYSHNTDNNEGFSEDLRTLCLGYSVECFTTLLRFFCRWRQSLPVKSTETSYIASLYTETFEGYFEQLARMTSFDMFETVVLPTILVEIVNSSDSLAQTLIFTSLIKEFDSKYLSAQLDALIKSSSQFAQGIDLKSLLDQLFRKVQIFNEEMGLFEAIWGETSKLIKNRCEIDQCDTVIISSLILNLISRSESNSNSKLKNIEIVLKFLVKTLKTIRPEGFNSELGIGVGVEIVYLIKGLIDDFDFKEIILNISTLPELLTCLKASSARKCCLKQILPKISYDSDHPEYYEKFMNLFSCLSRTDLIQLLDLNPESGSGSEEVLMKITEDLEEFSRIILKHFPANEQFFNVINSPNSCLNLFLLPELLEKCNFEVDLSKKMISSLLGNTSTVLPQRFEVSLKWIEPEYTKLMAVKMNLRVIEELSERQTDPYEFYTEIITILNNNVSSDFLKIEIIDDVLSSLKKYSAQLTSSDFTCLLDHLSRESCQLLRKSDRCKILLKICELTPPNSTLFENLKNQICVLLNQIPISENEIKFEMICHFLLEIVNPSAEVDSAVETLFKWACEYVELVDSSRNDVKFYTLKMKYTSLLKDQQKEDKYNNDIDRDLKYIDTDPYTNDQCTNEPFTAEESYTTNDHYTAKDKFHSSSDLISNPFVDEKVIEEDLQKLKIFESFQL